MLSGKALILALSTFMVMVRCGAFQVPPSHHPLTRRSSDTALGVSEQKPRWTDLPRERKTIPELSGFEINTGRLAMLGFCGLFAREVVSGESFGEQIIHVFSTSSLANLPI
jgi:hypothetical protein